jgi:Helicase conserved C-terminal domain
MGAITTLRCAGAFARIDASVEVAMQILHKEPAIVIFTSFVKVAKAIHQKLDKNGWAGEILTGETPAIKRQAMVDNFQSGVSPVFVCTFGAGGVGITLTAARTLILVDRPWTPGDVYQAEDRVRRYGGETTLFALTYYKIAPQLFSNQPNLKNWSDAPCKVYLAVILWYESNVEIDESFHATVSLCTASLPMVELDRHMDSMIESKSKTSNAVLMDGNKEVNDRLNAAPPSISIFQLLATMVHAGLSGTSGCSTSARGVAGLP